MKKTIALLAVLSLVLSLSACTINLAPEDKTSTESTTKTTVKNPTKETIVKATDAPTTAPTKQPTEVPSTTVSAPCLSIILATDMVILDKSDTPHLLSYTLQPANTTDKVTFTSENPEIATVDATGTITPVAEGETKIIIQCGTIQKTCMVYCQFAEDSTTPTTTPTTPQQGTIRLNRKDMTLTTKGDSWELYSGDIAKNLVFFTSDDEAVATFIDGRVVAVGNGMTTVYATYGDQKVSCIVRCSFQESSGVQGNGGVSEDGGGSGNVGTPVNLSGKIVNVQVDLNVRADAGTEYAKIGTLPLGQQVTITEVKYDSTGMQWGLTQAGWVRMDFVQLDSN